MNPILIFPHFIHQFVIVYGKFLSLRLNQINHAIPVYICELKYGIRLNFFS